MRLDKFLKVSRIIKRRTVAKSACDSGKISVNDKVAKASSKLNVGDVITIVFGTSSRKYRILSIDEKASKKEASDLYEVISL